MKKRGGSREKGGGGNEIHAPCACGVISYFSTNVTQWVSYILLLHQCNTMGKSFRISARMLLNG